MVEESSVELDDLPSFSLTNGGEVGLIIELAIAFVSTMVTVDQLPLVHRTVSSAGHKTVEAHVFRKTSFLGSGDPGRFQRQSHLSPQRP